jgi:oxygen-independent coproporphyrinogen-3 oxidase
MAGIYIHIPFCKTRCVYCDFFSSTESSLINPLIDAECKELELFTKDFTEPIETIYFGGGTPSFIDPNQLEKLLNTIHKNYNCSQPEITLEVNPDDISIEKLKQYLSLGINRISIGIQSFDDNVLKFLSRRHSAKQAIDAVNNTFNAGFKNISIDLIYGIPDLSLKTWTETLRTALRLPVQHISAYHLSVEENTPLHKLLQNNQIKLLPEDKSIKQYELLCQLLQDNTFQHYEISNFAKPGFRSKHNSSYWKGVKYLGIGPSAHSYIKYVRRWNVSSLESYIKSIHAGQVYSEYEELGIQERFNDYLITRLRTSEGGFLNELQSLDEHVFKSLFSKLEKETTKGNIILDKQRFFIPADKWLLSDYIIKNLFF